MQIIVFRTITLGVYHVYCFPKLSLN